MWFGLVPLTCFLAKVPAVEKGGRAFHTRQEFLLEKGEGNTRALGE